MKIKKHKAIVIGSILAGCAAVFFLIAHESNVNSAKAAVEKMNQEYRAGNVEGALQYVSAEYDGAVKRDDLILALSNREDEAFFLGSSLNYLQHFSTDLSGWPFFSPKVKLLVNGHFVIMQKETGDWKVVYFWIK